MMASVLEAQRTQRETSGGGGSGDTWLVQFWFSVLRAAGSYCHPLGCGGDDTARFASEEELSGYSMATG